MKKEEAHFLVPYLKKKAAHELQMYILLLININPSV